MTFSTAPSMRSETQSEWPENSGHSDMGLMKKSLEVLSLTSRGATKLINIHDPNRSSMQTW